jgi:hypothetical protein
MDSSRDIDERDILCEAHKSYMERFIAFELLRQEKMSDKFLKGRSYRHDLLRLPESPEVESMPDSSRIDPGAFLQ